ncbi:MAG: hypothetical protein JRG91_17110, partial [Deltaproteobacteria bacterium]|nr:hypothetical protein [Deltaproteobacteria bacterium]
MQRKILNALVLSLIVACGPAGQGDIEGPEGEGDEDLVEAAEPWEGEPLEPVLIGELPDKNDDPIREPGKQKDGGLYVIVDTPYQIWTGAGTYIHLGAWDENWEPAAGARIFVDNDEVGKTNKHGTLVFQYVPNKSDGYSDHNLWAVLDRGGKRHVGNVYFSANRRTESFESANLFVYTDRGVFNPGQTIHVRALAWTLRGEFQPLAHKEVEILIKNDKNRVVGGGSTETDEWGILSHDIPLPKHAPEGNYTLQANFERESAEAKIRIERFVPPVIEIRHDLGRFLTRDQKTLPFEVNLGYFGGGTFESGKMKVAVKAQGKQLFKETRSVTGEGPFKFELSEKNLGKIRSGLNENDKVQVVIKVTDNFGRSDEVKRDLRYVTNPYVAVIITDKESYGEGDPVLVSVRIRDLDHVPIRGKEVKCVIGGETFKEKTDDDGVAEFRTKMGNTTLSVEAYMKGVTSAVAYYSLYFRYSPPMLSEIPGGKVGEREMTEIVVRFPGEYVPAEEVIHADVTDSSGSIVYGFEIPIKKEGKKYLGKTEFPGPSWGSMLIT